MILLIKYEYQLLILIISYPRKVLGSILARVWLFLRKKKEKKMNHTFSVQYYCSIIVCTVQYYVCTTVAVVYTVVQ